MEKTITITVRCFSLVKDALQKSAFELKLANGETANQALERVKKMLPPELKALPIRMAINHEYITGDAALCDRDELALIPPVSGG